MTISHAIGIGILLVLAAIANYMNYKSKQGNKTD